MPGSDPARAMTQRQHSHGNIWIGILSAICIPSTVLSSSTPSLLYCTIPLVYPQQHHCSSSRHTSHSTRPRPTATLDNSFPEHRAKEINIVETLARQISSSFSSWLSTLFLYNTTNLTSITYNSSSRCRLQLGQACSLPLWPLYC